MSTTQCRISLRYISPRHEGVGRSGRQVPLILSLSTNAFLTLDVGVSLRQGSAPSWAEDIKSLPLPGIAPFRPSGSQHWILSKLSNITTNPVLPSYSMKTLRLRLFPQRTCWEPGSLVLTLRRPVFPDVSTEHGAFTFEDCPKYEEQNTTVNLYITNKGKLI